LKPTPLAVRFFTGNGSFSEAEESKNYGATTLLCQPVVESAQASRGKHKNKNPALESFDKCQKAGLI
jgi:hypothetical protein